MLENQVFNAIREQLLSSPNGEKTDTPLWQIMTVPMEIHMPAKLNSWGVATEVKRIPYALKGSKVGSGLGEHGALVLAPGRAESSIEYFETAYDFIKKGFSPVYIIDHVGQGFSPRLIQDDYHKAHIHDFNDYVFALDAFVKAVEKDLNEVEGRKNPLKHPEAKPLFFTSNSMGGAIGIGYFQMKGQDNPFKTAAILGPMLKVNYLGFPGGLSDAKKNPNGIECPNFLQKILGSEYAIILNAIIQSKLYGYAAYTTSNARAMAKEFGTDYLYGQRDFKQCFTEAPEQVLSHSSERYRHKTFLWESDEMNNLYTQMGLSSPIVGTPTVRWASQCAHFNRNIRKEENLRKMTSYMPLAIITGERDVRVYNPKSDCTHDLSNHIKFCNKINKVLGQNICSFTEVKGAFHELYKESDEYRDQAFTMVIDHFLK